MTATKRVQPVALRHRSRKLVVLSAALVATSCASLPGTSSPAPASARLATASTSGYVVGSRVWVNVAVATVWTSSTAPRRVDAKALSAPVDIRGWLAAMSTTARRGLVGRVETQALYGDRLLVTAVKPGWIRVVVPNQPTRRNSRGYPGWVPKRQVTTRAPLATQEVATVVGSTTTWLRNAVGRRVVEVSIGTRLPVVSLAGSQVVVASPTHAHLRVASAVVAVRRAGVPAQAKTRSAVIKTARTFLGRPYLWGGRSGFAVDCSGLVELVYADHGIVMPRDADDQALSGSRVSLTALRLADLVFFKESSTVAHVGIYVGHGQMLHAPHTGTSVQIGSIGQPALARRVL